MLALKMLFNKDGEDHVITVLRDLDKENVEVSREESGGILRHINCHGFIHPENIGERCATCSMYQGVLRKLRSRHGDEKPVCIYNAHQ